MKTSGAAWSLSLMGCLLSARAAAQSAPAASAIRRVDFHRLAYRVPGVERPLHLRDGALSPRDAGADVRSLQVEQVAYGDLDGDGVEEAVVRLGHQGDGPGRFSTAQVFAMRDGAATQVAQLATGDRCDGSVRSLRVDGPTLVVERYDGGGAARRDCTALTVERWRWNPRQGLTPRGAATRRAYLDAHRAGREDHEVRLLRGTTTATCEGTVTREAPSVWTFVARTGQTLRVDFDAVRPSTRVTLQDPDGAEVMTVARSASSTVRLPASGRYALSVRDVLTANYTMDVTFVPERDAARPTEAPARAAHGAMTSIGDMPSAR